VRLANANLAVIDLRKLREYSLNPDHPRGAHKARVFASALGYTFDDAERLREEILRAAVSQEAIKVKDDRYGSHYVVDFDLRSSSRSVTVRACWLVADAGEIPRLTSCFVL
jgi:hypothetical protein